MPKISGIALQYAKGSAATRVHEAPPFSRVGVDFAGPLNVKGSRALHLELVDDLSAHTFRRALRRF